VEGKGRHPSSVGTLSLHAGEIPSGLHKPVMARMDFRHRVSMSFTSNVGTVLGPLGLIVDDLRARVG
jgi:hypothetical protein